jgi:hypothetical protein
VSVWKDPSGRRTLTVLGATIGLAVISNLTATIFWHLTGGVGLLDLDGGANLLHPGAARPLPAPGTAERIQAILAAYTPHTRLIHAALLGSLDLVFPPLIGLTGWTTIAWASRSWAGRRRITARLLGAALALGYLGTDWAENATELLLLTGHRGRAVQALPHLTTGKLNVVAVLAAVALTTVTAQVLIRTWRTRSHPTSTPRRR